MTEKGDMHHPFEPKEEPARSIFTAFQNEADHRRSRTTEEWILAERRAVAMAAEKYARDHGLRVPTIAEIESAERSAMRHIDYGAKWAHEVARLMQSSG